MRKELEKAYDFEQPDLMLNQNGQLSKKQRSLLSEYDRAVKIGGRIAFTLIFVSTFSLTLIPLYFMGIERLQKQPEIFYIYIAVFSLIWILFLGFHLFGKMRSDLKSRKISTVEGSAECRTKKVRQWTAYYVKIGEVKFQVDTIAKYKAIKPDTVYRFFYIKHHPHIILSVDEVNTEK